jgi:arylsulfatase
VTNVEITDANASGVIFAHGSRFGGHSLFIKDHKLYYVYNFLGITEQQLVSEALKPGKYTFGMEFTREKAGEYKESVGTMQLYINDKAVAKGPMKAQVGKFTLVGDGLCVGFDSGDPVSKLYKSPGEFKGGNIAFVRISTGKEKYSDLQTEAARVWAIE